MPTDGDCNTKEHQMEQPSSKTKTDTVETAPTKKREPVIPRSISFDLNASDVALLLGVSCRTVYDLFRAGVIPGRRIGHRIQFPRQTILLLAVNAEAVNDASSSTTILSPTSGSTEQLASPAR